MPYADLTVRDVFPEPGDRLDAWNAVFVPYKPGTAAQDPASAAQSTAYVSLPSTFAVTAKRERGKVAYVGLPPRGGAAVRGVALTFYYGGKSVFGSKKVATRLTDAAGCATTRIRMRKTRLVFASLRSDPARTGVAPTLAPRCSEGSISPPPVVFRTVRVKAEMAARVRVGTCSWADEALSSTSTRRPARRRAPRALLRAVRHCGARLDLLPASGRVDGGALGRPDPERLRHAREGVRRDDPPSREEGAARPTSATRRRSTSAAGSIARRADFAASLRRFREALEPLRSASKLGGILFQFPPYVVYKDLSLDYLSWAREQMGEDEMLVEFRHRSWYEEDVRSDVLSFLEEHGMSLVVVDAPKVEAKNVPPTLLALTSPPCTSLPRTKRQKLGMCGEKRRRALRLPLHGGRASRVGRAAEELSAQAENAYAVFSNNSRARQTAASSPRRRRTHSSSNGCCSRRRRCPREVGHGVSRQVPGRRGLAASSRNSRRSSLKRSG